MFVKHWGDPTAKHAVLLHGLASSSSTWAPIAHHLANAGYYVTAPDLPGHGRTPWDREYTLEAVTDALAAVLPQNPALLVGHSLGGLLAAHIAPVLKPERTLLIDPVFHFPAVKPITFLARKGFNLVIKQPLLYSWERKRNGTRSALVGLANLRAWDQHSNVLLVDHPNVVSSFKQNAVNTIILRPKGSYVLPSRIVKTFPKSIQTISVKGTHTLHIDQQNKFFGLLNQWLSLPLATTPAL